MKPSLALPTLAALASLTFSHAAEWQPVLTDLLKSEKTGYGGLCGIVVDHTSGDVFVNLSDLGMYRSSDEGKSWKPATKEPLKGRTESPGCWSINPTGRDKTMVTALVYGAPIAVSTDDAFTFRTLDARSEHIDWCAVDWTDPAMNFILALKHEQGGLLIASNDGGKSFRDVGPGYISGWVFDEKTAVVAKETADGVQLVRSTDGGKTFAPCGNFAPVGSGSAGTLPKWKDGKLYWLTRSGLISTADKGETWEKIAEAEGGLSGPIFGKSSRHYFLLTQKGILETTDAGASFSEPIPAPEALGNLAGLTWLEYDPTRDTLYLMKMTSDLYRLKR